MPEIIGIAPLKRKHLPQMLEIERQSFPDPWGPISFRSVLSSRICKNLGMFGAGEMLLGYILCQKILDELHILNIAVHPSHRRRGIAEKLMLEALEQTGSEVEKVWLEVRVTNHPAIEFYRKHEFELMWIRKNYYPNGEDAYIMVKERKGSK